MDENAPSPVSDLKAFTFEVTMIVTVLETDIETATAKLDREGGSFAHSDRATRLIKVTDI